MSTLAIEITSERTALVSGAGDEKVELSAENGQSIHAVIAQFSRQHSADAGSPVEVTVQVPTQIDIPLWGSQTVTLTGKGTFRCEV